MKSMRNICNRDKSSSVRDKSKGQKIKISSSPAIPYPCVPNFESMSGDIRN
jgi:hypothetical protein